MAQSTQTTYSVDPNGTIFAEILTVVTDDISGLEIARGTQRTPYTPDTDPKTLTDTTIAAYAAIAWTTVAVAAYKAQLAASALKFIPEN